MNLTRHRIGDYITDVASGPFGSNLKVECFTPTGFPIIDGANLTGLRVTDNITKFVTETKARSLSRSIAKRRDVIVTISGTLGQIAYIPNNSKYEEYLCSQRQFRATFDESKICVEYLVNLFHTPYGQRKILAFANYVGVPALAQPIPNFKNIEMHLPDLPTQLRIAGVLGSLDEKIELNRKKIAELEALAKTIYDYWFVQFDFPDANGKPYKSSGGKMVWNEQLKRDLPEGWEVAMLESIFTVCSGRDHKHLPDGKFPILGSGGTMRYGSEYLYDSESVLIPRKGTLNNVMFMQTPFWTVDTMFFTRAKRPHLMKYVYMTIRDFDFARLNTGTGVPSMTSSIINRIAITVPPKDLAERFDILLGDCFSRIELIKSEIEMLRTERDTLLPLLMNGQVKVAG